MKWKIHKMRVYSRMKRKKVNWLDGVLGKEVEGGGRTVMAKE